MPWDGIILFGSKIVELLCDIFLLGCAFLNSCFGIWPKLFMKPIVAFFFKGSSILAEMRLDLHMLYSYPLDVSHSHLLVYVDVAFVE